MAGVLPPIVKQVVVKADPARAFTRFTREIQSWWPLASHSVFGGEAESLVFEERVGGRILERAPGGRECSWGTVLEYDPPRRVVFTWHPGREAPTAQTVELVFAPEGDRTRVTLTHSGWEHFGSGAKQAHGAYPLGWRYVLGRFADERSVAMWALTTLTNLVVAMVRRGKKREQSTP